MENKIIILQHPCYFIENQTTPPLCIPSYAKVESFYIFLIDFNVFSEILGNHPIKFVNDCMINKFLLLDDETIQYFAASNKISWCIDLCLTVFIIP